MSFSFQGPQEEESRILIDEEESGSIYLSVCHGGGKLGAAFYNSSTSILHLMNDVIDYGPQFLRLQSIFQQIMPTHLIVNKRLTPELGTVVRRLCKVPPDPDATEEDILMAEDNVDPEISFEIEIESVSESAAGSVPDTSTVQLMKLHPRAFKHASCMRRLLSIRLPGESVNSSENDHRILMSGLVDFSAESAVRAAGALLHCLDEIGGEALHFEREDPLDGGLDPFIVLAIRQFYPIDVLGIDEMALKSLQIFNPAWKPSASRVGSWNQEREGLSLFNILNRCKSTNGVKHLRSVCRTVTRDLAVIQERQNFVATFSKPIHVDLIRELQNCIKNIKSLNRILKKLLTNQASVKDWKCLKSTLLHIGLLIELCDRYVTCNREFNLDVLRKIASKLSSGHLRKMIVSVDRIFDANTSVERNRFAVLSGVNSLLDKKRRLHNGLPDLLNDFVQDEIDNLPDCMNECTMLYVPNIGYILAVQPWWRENEPMPDIEHFENLKFMFMVGTVPHFKSQKCEELDENLGDTATEIGEIETGIMIKLSDVILKNTDLLLEISQLTSELDVLLSFAIVALERDWVRPNLIDTKPSNPIYIKEGRHPLQELSSNSFVPNTTLMGETLPKPPGEERIVILTGPNACGKSVYLKQVGLIVYLAHLGSFVPAEAADLPLLTSIHTRIQSQDSVEHGLSSFAVDLNQMTSALRGASESSLVLVDEFGKGTKSSDGLALLAASIEHLVLLDNECPFVIVSTHFHGIKTLLPDENPVISYKTFAREFHQGKLVQLFKLIDGMGISSQAIRVAQQAGISNKTLKRALTILRCQEEGTSVPIPKSMYPVNDFYKVCDRFLDIDLEASDASKKIEAIFKLIEQLKI